MKMGNQCGNLLKLGMLRFNVTFWVQIFRMRNFRNVYFQYLNLQKFKQILEKSLKNFKNFMICKRLSCKILCITQFAKVYPKNLDIFPS